MHLKSILNHVERHKRFVYQKPRWSSDGQRIEIPIEPRKNSRAICSGCHQQRPGYDRLPAREFQYVPLWNIAVVFVYAMRRVDCPQCGIIVESVPWGVGKHGLTRSFIIFLASWSKRLSWSEVATIFGTTWHRVFDAVRWVVEFGLSQRNISEVTAIGVDEIQYGKGHQYLTMVYQIDNNTKRLLYVGVDRTARTLLRFFHDCGRCWCQNIQFVCSDMWKPYLKVIAKKLSNAVHVMDRFHVIANLNKALNEIRASEARQMFRQGYEDVLKHTKYCFLKNPENLTPGQKLRLSDILQYDLKSVRAYLLKESFQIFWTYNSPYWAEWFLKKWCIRAMRSKLEPIKKFVRMIRNHQDLMLNWFRARKAFSSGVVEGLNRKVNLITRKSYGFKNVEVLKIALYHTLGKLPEPEVTHKF